MTFSNHGGPLIGTARARYRGCSGTCRYRTRPPRHRVQPQPDRCVITAPSRRDLPQPQTSPIRPRRSALVVAAVVGAGHTARLPRPKRAPQHTWGARARQVDRADRRARVRAVRRAARAQASEGYPGGASEEAPEDRADRARARRPVRPDRPGAVAGARCQPRAGSRSPGSKSLRHHPRCRSFSFSRAFALPKTVDAEAIDAKLEEGVLRLRLPKRAASEKRRIEIPS